MIQYVTRRVGIVVVASKIAIKLIVTLVAIVGRICVYVMTVADIKIVAAVQTTMIEIVLARLQVIQAGIQAGRVQIPVVVVGRIVQVVGIVVVGDWIVIMGSLIHHKLLNYGAAENKTLQKNHKFL